jgi:hypothetical protein
MCNASLLLHHNSFVLTRRIVFSLSLSLVVSSQQKSQSLPFAGSGHPHPHHTAHHLDLEAFSKRVRETVSLQRAGAAAGCGVWGRGGAQ